VLRSPRGRRHLLLCFCAMICAWYLGPRVATPAAAQDTFKINPPGVLTDPKARGLRDYRIHAPDMTFPIDAPTTTINSQVYNAGGQFGPAGGQCSPSNFNEAWSDNYCESRSGRKRESLCASPAVHQGNDIRGGSVETCRALAKNPRANNVPVVAVYKGVVTRIGDYTVYLNTARGTFRYMHLNMQALSVKAGDEVTAGQPIGFMSNFFGKSPTTFHMHFEHWTTMQGVGRVPVPVYCSLVLAYERKTKKRHEMLDGSQRCGGDASAPATPATPAPPPPAATPAGPVAGNDPALTAAVVSYWRYNDIELRLAAPGARRVFIVGAPPESMPFLKSGDVIFDGSKLAEAGGRYRGQMYDYRPECKPLGFEVEGPVENAGERLVLSGNRPLRGADCQVTGTIEDRMIIVFDRPLAPPPPPVVPATPAPAASASADSKANGRVQPRCTRETCVDRQQFLAAVRPFYLRQSKRRLNQWQEDAFNAIFNVWDTDPTMSGANRLAYILGTIYHESAHNIYPVREGKCRTDAGAVAVVRRLFQIGKASDYYLRDKETDQSYYGRGQVQVTLKTNYERIGGGKLGLGRQLILSPDDTLSFELSSLIAAKGIYEGWFTGRKLAGRALDTDEAWLAARDIVIAKRRDAGDVAFLGKQMLPMLKFISKAEFERKSVAGNGVADSGPVPTKPTSPQPDVPQDAAKPAPEVPVSSSFADATPVPEAPAGAASTTAIQPVSPSAGAVKPVGRNNSVSISDPGNDSAAALANGAPAASAAPPAQASVPGSAPLPEGSVELKRPERVGVKTPTLSAPVADLPQDLGPMVAAATPAASASAAPQTAAPQVDPRLLDQLRRLDDLATDMQQRSADLSRQVSSLRSVIEFAVGAPQLGSKSDTGGADMGEAFDQLASKADGGGVDFKSVWPPGHVESKWCQATGSKANDDLKLEADDPLVLEYGEELIGVGGGSAN
jgi:Peptidase family M23